MELQSSQKERILARLEKQKALFELNRMLVIVSNL